MNCSTFIVTLGVTPGTGSPGRAVCSQGWDLSKGTLSSGEGGVRGGSEPPARASQRSRGPSTGHMARKPSRRLGAQAVGIILLFRF